MKRKWSEVEILKTKQSFVIYFTKHFFRQFYHLENKHDDIFHTKSDITIATIYNKSKKVFYIKAGVKDISYITYLRSSKS